MITPDQRVPWYYQGLCFQCQGCGACCRGPGGYVWISPDEITEIAGALGMSDEEFGYKYLRRTPTGLALVDSRSGDCPFLNGAGRCAIYHARPVQCRTWPWWRENLTSPEAWESAARRCPGMGRHERHSLFIIETEAAKDF
ncbi:MAG: YkgJ family cysteine cluster protein [Planctomycetota bacterium]|jgi:Fe-S-cluster containining protein|nr:YkgJ family cysteine cluster protein [Planctomycetota bacterium]